MTRPNIDETKIRETAYHFWLEEGRPAGRDQAHWLKAIDALAPAEPKAKPARKIAAKPRATKAEPAPKEKAARKAAAKSKAAPAAKKPRATKAAKAAKN